MSRAFLQRKHLNQLGIVIGWLLVCVILISLGEKAYIDSKLEECVSAKLAWKFVNEPGGEVRFLSVEESSRLSEALSETTWYFSSHEIWNDLGILRAEGCGYGVVFYQRRGRVIVEACRVDGDSVVRTAWARSGQALQVWWADFSAH